MTKYIFVCVLVTLTSCSPVTKIVTSSPENVIQRACLVDQPEMTMQNRNRAAAELARLGSGSASELFISDYINYRAAIRKACEE